MFYLHAILSITEAIAVFQWSELLPRSGTSRSSKGDGQQSLARSGGEMCDLIFSFYKVP